MARASSVFPVPGSPTIRTGASVCATRSTSVSTAVSGANWVSSSGSADGRCIEAGDCRRGSELWGFGGGDTLSGNVGRSPESAKMTELTPRYVSMAFRPLAPRGGATTSFARLADVDDWVLSPDSVDRGKEL